VATRVRLSVSEILGSILSPWPSPPTPVAGTAAMRLTTDRSVYRAGEQGAVIVRNESSCMVRLSLCSRQLEQELGDAWLVRDRSPGPGEISTAPPVLLPPGATTGASFRLPRGLGPGIYRWRFLGTGEQQRGNGERLTNSFGIEA
jgi:hypothetical protein